MFIALSNCVVPILFFLLQGAVGEPYYFPYDVSETSLGFLQSETEGFDTDLFRLSIQNSTVIPNAHGLFSKQNLSPNTTNEVVKIICEFRGYLIPMDSVLPGSVLPSVANEVTGDVYALEGNSVCHHVQDCVDLNSNPSGGTDSRNRTGFDLYPNCIYNTMLIYEFGKAFLVPLREIKAGDELFASFGAPYWALRMARFEVEGARDLRSIMNHPLVKEATHTDYLSVYAQPSLLPVPRIGMGLFAKHFIAAGSIIVEHRGIARTASSFSSNNSVVNNNLTDRVADKGSEGYFIEFSAPSSLINDAAWVYNRAYTAGELMQMYEHDSREYGVLPDTPGFSTNVARVKFTDNPNENAALFIMATVDIPAGAELFCSYGKSFWKYDLFSQVLVEDIPKS